MQQKNTPQLLPLALSQAVLFVVTWVALFVFSWLLTRSDENFIATCIGVGFAQVNLAAAFLALGTCTLIVRLEAAAVLITLAYLATVCSFTRTEEWEIYIGILVGFLAEFVVIQTPLWLMRLGLGWRVDHSSRLSADESISSRQFTIRELLISTTVIAVLLAIARGAILSLSIGTLSQTRNQELQYIIALFSLMAGFNLLLAWPVIGAVLMARGQVFTIPLVIAVAIAATYVEELVFSAIFGGGGTDVYHFFGLLNGSHFMLLLLAFGVARGFGYRFAGKTNYGNNG